MTFWRNVIPNMLLQGQNAVLVVKKTPQNFYQCCSSPCIFFQKYNWWSDPVLRKIWLDLLLSLFAKSSTELYQLSLCHLIEWLQCTFCLLLLRVAFDDIRDADRCSSLRHEEDDAKLDCLAIDAAD